jgi:hypothetical protein
VGTFGVDDGSDFDMMAIMMVLPLRLAAAAAILTRRGSHKRVFVESVIKHTSVQQMHSSSTSNTSLSSPLTDASEDKNVQRDTFKPEGNDRR